MAKLKDLVKILNAIIPLEVSSASDNVGVLLTCQKYGQDALIKKIMICVTITLDVAYEARDNQVNLIISHHPIMFGGIKKLAIDNADNLILAKLISANIAVYCAHTAFDNLFQHGINHQILYACGSGDIDYIIKGGSSSNKDNFGVGFGQGGYLKLSIAVSYDHIITSMKKLFGLDKIKMVYNKDLNQRLLNSSFKHKHKILKENFVKVIASGCGVGSFLVDDCINLNCDLFITGELRYHECLKLSSNGVSVILAGHFYSERFAMDRIPELLKDYCSDITIFSSDKDKCPVHMV